MTQIQNAQPDADAVITPELVAKAIAGISVVGYASNALDATGWEAKIVANRIIVNEVVEAQLISSNGTMWWNVYSVDGTPPIFTVGAQNRDHSNWIGCVE